MTAWGRQFYQPTGQSYRIIEIEVPDDVVAMWYRDAKLDAIGPAVYAAVDQLAELNSAMTGLREVAAGP